MTNGFGTATGALEQLANSSSNGMPSVPLIFAAPRSLLFQGSFDNAREAAKQSQRWLLVNIQAQTEFQSLVLNRDLWSNDVIQNTVHNSFIFWQQERTTMDAQRFLTLYNPGPSLPHVCIIDPRTGERLSILRLKATDDDLRMAFFEQITAFLEKQSFKMGGGSQQNDSYGRGSDVYASSAQGLSPSTSSFNSELERALAASTEFAHHESGPASSPSVVDLLDEDAEAVYTRPDIYTGPVPPEPDASNSDATVIRFKFPDGSAEKRRFLKEAKVQGLFAFVASHAKGKDLGANFDLITSEKPSRSMLEQINKSIQEADACNQMLMVRTKSTE